jgi:hypothetical protein
VVVGYVNPLLTSVRVTLAPGTTPPEGSVTTPVREAVVCAHEGQTISPHRQTNVREARSQQRTSTPLQLPVGELGQKKFLEFSFSINTSHHTEV